LRAFENRVLKTIFGPKREEMEGGWRRLQNEELHNLYASPNSTEVIKPKRMRLVIYVARIVEIKNAYMILVGKPEGKRPLRRPRRRWENNNGMDPRKIG